MNPRKLIMILIATALLAGAGVAGAFASSPGHAVSGGTSATTGTTTCSDQGQQGEDDQGQDEQDQQDQESDAATEVEHAAAQVGQEAGRQQSDDQSGDDQPGDDQGEDGDCGD
jgi:Sec-independent protein translocase protein TatA